MAFRADGQATGFGVQLGVWPVVEMWSTDDSLRQYIFKQRVYVMRVGQEEQPINRYGVCRLLQLP